MKNICSIALVLIVSVFAPFYVKSQVTGTGTSNYLPKWSTATSLTNSLVYDNGTNIGIGTTSPVALWQVQNGSVLFNGSTGGVPISNTAGIRLMWVPNKASLRFGELVTGTKWDASNIGHASFAGGLDSWADADNSFAFGEGCYAGINPSSLHNHSNVAMGGNATATGTSSIALGENVLSIGGGGSISLGLYSSATAPTSIAIGNAVTSSGNSAVAIGTGAESTGDNSVAIGSIAYASGYHSIAIGTQSQTDADGEYSIAIGDGAGNDGHNRSIIFNDDDDGATNKLKNTADNQFMAKYMGGYILYSDYDAINENAFHLKEGSFGIGTVDFQEKLNLDGNVAFKSSIDVYPNDNITKKIYIDTFFHNSCQEAYGNHFLVKAGSVSVNCDDDNDAYGGSLMLYGGDVIQPIYSSGATHSTGGDVFIRGGLGIGSSPVNGDVVIGNTLNEYITLNSKVVIGTGGTSSYYLRLTADQAAKPSTNTWTISSDARLKKDISPFEDGLSVINGIKPIRYYYNGLAGTPTDKENIGILAQDIKEVAPYTVGTFKAKLNPEDKEETELLDFNSHALTFVLINAVKELDERTKSQQPASSQNNDIKTLDLQAKIIELEKQVKSLNTMLQNICNQPCFQEQQNSKEVKPYLLQNVPNPSSGTTTIPYFIPEAITNAEIKITDANGKLVSVYKLVQKGKGQLDVVINVSQGVYYYTLYADDKMVETKTMSIVQH